MTDLSAPARRPRTALAMAAGLSLLLAACSPAPSGPPPTVDVGPTGLATDGASPSPLGAADAKAIYAAIAAQVEAIRGLHPTADVTPVLLDEAQLRANLTADFDAQNPPGLIATSEHVLQTLGLLAPTASLRVAYLDLQSGQVAGYYSPERNELFVVSRSGDIGPTQKSTYAHEFTHQLQDQNFDLDSLHLDAIDQGDRSMARLALVEGDATHAQTTWMTSHLTAAELGQILADASDPAALAALQRAPAFLRETTFFSYTEGLQFVTGLLASGGQAAVDAAFRDPPDSTEQILHPEKYASRERPVTVTLPPNLAASVGSGWTGSAQDTMGELLLRIWLREGGVPAAVATTAAAGWGGDRSELLAGPDGTFALAIQTTWDTQADADEFAAAADAAIAGLGLVGDSTHVLGSLDVSILLGVTKQGV